MAASEGGQQLFPSAQNVVIHSGNFTTVGGNATIYHYGSTAVEHPGKILLLANITPSAFHDAAERGDPPKCHPHTRIAVLDEIMNWIKDPEARQQFITWLYGPAGSGKTAIAQNIAEACAKEGLLAASFFFGRTAAGRNTSTHFVTTIAYQLCKYIPEIENRVFTAIEADPTIFSRSLSTQIQVLIIGPLASAQLTSPPKVVVVDGVDECGPDDQAHAELLNILGVAVRELRSVPIIFLICSRPEYEIRTAFSKDALSSLSKSLVLDDKYQPDNDIKNYLESRFRDIQQQHLPFAEKPWPTRSDVDFLVQKASGQFIYASTVIKFIDSPRHSPDERLKIIMRLSNVGNETPFALLDALYRFILGSVANVQQVLDILMLIMLSGEDTTSHLSIHMAGELLGFNVRIALVDMHALIFVPPPPDNRFSELRIHHASLYDFLMDSSRSREYYIDATQGHVTLSQRWSKIIGIHLQSRLCGNSIAIDALCHHGSNLNATAEIMDNLAHLDLGLSLEGISHFSRDLYCVPWDRFAEISQKLGYNISPPIQDVLIAFIMDRITQYPPNLRSYILIQILRNRTFPDEAWNISLRSASKSAEEYNELRNLDARLLDLHSVTADSGWNYICTLLRDTNDRAIKGIVNKICSKRNFLNERHPMDSIEPTTRIYIQYADLSIVEAMLQCASVNLDLANFLLSRTVQFRNDVQPIPGRRIVAEASLEYIQRCGIPFLEHTHQRGTNECVICTKYKHAIVILDRMPDITSAHPPSPETIANTSTMTEARGRKWQWRWRGKE